MIPPRASMILTPPSCVFLHCDHENLLLMPDVGAVRIVVAAIVQTVVKLLRMTSKEIPCFLGRVSPILIVTVATTLLR